MHAAPLRWIAVLAFILHLMTAPAAASESIYEGDSNGAISAKLQRPGYALLTGRHFSLLADAPHEFVPGENDTKRLALFPQAYLIMGRTLYAGVGIGTTYYERRLATSPFVGMRSGLSITLFSRWELDISVQWHIRDSASGPHHVMQASEDDQRNITGTLRWSF